MALAFGMLACGGAAAAVQTEALKPTAPLSTEGEPAATVRSPAEPGSQQLDLLLEASSRRSVPTALPSWEHNQVKPAAVTAPEGAASMPAGTAPAAGAALGNIAPPTPGATSGVTLPPGMAAPIPESPPAASAGGRAARLRWASAEGAQAPVGQGVWLQESTFGRFLLSHRNDFVAALLALLGFGLLVKLGREYRRRASEESLNKHIRRSRRRSRRSRSSSEAESTGLTESGTTLSPATDTPAIQERSSAYRRSRSSRRPEGSSAAGARAEGSRSQRSRA